MRRLGLLCLVCACGGPRNVECPEQASRGTAYQPIETRCDVRPTATNPFDPRELEITGELEGPDGGVATMPGFLGKDFTRSLSDAGVEVLEPRGEPSWRVRFTPTSAGTWRWRWRVLSAEVNEATPWQTLRVDAGTSHGFLRRGATQLKFDDGAPYLAIGENIAWADARGTFAYDDWFQKLHQSGGTFARVWMANWGFGVEWEQLGRYDNRYDRAWALDQVLESARANGISVMLCLQPHGELSTQANSNWDQSPYKKENGGPLSTPEQFFVHPEAKRLFEQRLQYVVARWGAFPQVLAFELFNEADLTLQMSPDVQAAWHAQMAAKLKALDPNRHLVTTSLSGLLGPVIGLEEPVFALDDIDIAQLHLYGGAGAVIDFTAALPQAVTALARFKKPVLAAEVGVDFRSPEATLMRDPTSSGTHDFIWAGAMSGAMGTGMSWWWDSVIDPKNLYGEYGPVASLFAGESLEGLGPPPNASAGTLTLLGLQGPESMFFWVKNPADTYYLGPDVTVFTGAFFGLTGAKDGTWRVTFVNPRGGPTPAPSRTVIATQGRINLTLPAFSRDIALRLNKL